MPRVRPPTVNLLPTSRALRWPPGLALGIGLACAAPSSEDEPPDAGSTGGEALPGSSSSGDAVEPSTGPGDPERGTRGGGDETTGGVPDGQYPVDPQPLDPRQCAAEHAGLPAAPPPECADPSRRTCIDDAGRWWHLGAPFFPVGVYNGGFEWAQLQDNCPPRARCQATTPRTVDAYLALLASGGINVVMERSRFTLELTAAINRHPDIYIAHLLWADMFADQAAHDAMVDEIEAAAADPDVVMWFGPDEVDLNDNFAMAAGIRRLLRGDSRALDDFITTYSDEPPAYFPASEPAHDPHALPYGAALAWDWGLDFGPEMYDVLLPITYPYETEFHAAHEGRWGTWRIDEWGERPVMPVLQMIGIPVMGLSHPTPEQIEALGYSALIQGAGGFFHYNVIGDQPNHAGRDGWFAPDDADNWEAHARVHGAILALLVVTHAAQSVQMGPAPLQWRRWTLSDRRVVAFANPTADAGEVDLDVIVQRQPGEYVRHYLDCTPLASPLVEIAPYETLLLEVY